MSGFDSKQLIAGSHNGQIVPGTDAMFADLFSWSGVMEYPEG